MASPKPESQDDIIKRVGIGTHGDKAGMEGFNKEEANRIIYEASKDSKYFKNEKRKEKILQQKLNDMKGDLKKFSRLEILAAERSVDEMIVQYEKSRDLTQCVIHVDMDAFYAMVEERDNPELRGKPVAVGGGVLGTSNYVARKFGVRSGMAEHIARRLCPELIVVHTHFEKYEQASQEARKIFGEFGTLPEIMWSLDEASINITDFLARTGRTPASVAEEIRRRVREGIHLTCSVGIGVNGMIAKIASDMNKPDGQYEVPPDREEIVAFMAKLPVRKIPGIGKVTEKSLIAIGCTTCGMLYEMRGQVCLVLSEISTRFFMMAALGLQPGYGGEVHSSSISNERTFRPTSQSKVLEGHLIKLVTMVCKRVREQNKMAKLFTLKMKAATFEVKQESVRLPFFADDEKKVLPRLLSLLKTDKEYRLIGVKASEFKDEVFNRLGRGQKTLDAFITPARDSKKRKVEKFSFRCPVCLQRFVAATNREINRHVDICLNKAPVVSTTSGGASLSDDDVQCVGSQKPKPSEDDNDAVSDGVECIGSQP